MMRELIFAGVVFSASAALGQSDQSGDYGILKQTSIFQADRGIGQPGSRPGPGATVRPDAPAPLLVGVIEDDRAYTAFVQLRSASGSGTLVKLREGDSILWNGNTVVLREITWDGISVSGVKTAPGLIRVGRDLTDQLPLENAGPMVHAVTPPDSAVNRNARALGAPGRAGGIVILAAPGSMVSRDEPLPPGTADDLVWRMRARRQAELAAGG